MIIVQRTSKRNTHTHRREGGKEAQRGVLDLNHYIVGLEQLQSAALPKDGAQCLVLPIETQPHQSVPATPRRYAPG